MKSLLDVLKRQYGVLIETSELKVGDIWHFNNEPQSHYIVVSIEKHRIHMSTIQGKNYAWIDPKSDKMRFLVSNRAPTQKEIEECLDK